MRFYLLIIIIILLLSQVLCLSAMPNKRGWTVSTSQGLHWGQAREIVFYVPTPAYSTQSKYLSLLLWDMNNTIMLGFDIRWESGNILGLELDFDVAVPGMSAGEMNDYDWFFTDRDWSHWSVSDVNLRRGISAGASTDWRVLDAGALSLHVGVAYHADLWAWTDKLKNLIYSTTVEGIDYPVPFDENPEHVFRDSSKVSSSLGKNAVDFEVAYHSILAVFKLRVQNTVLFAEFTARIGPAFIHSLDFHKLRDFKIVNSGFGFPWIDGTVDVGVRFSPRCSLILRGEIGWMNETVTDTKYYTSSGDYIGDVKNAGGSGVSHGSIGIRFSWAFDPREPRRNT